MENWGLQPLVKGNLNIATISRRVGVIIPHGSRNRLEQTYQHDKKIYNCSNFGSMIIS